MDHNILPFRPQPAPAASRSVNPNPRHGEQYCDHDYPFDNPWDLAISVGSWLFCMMNSPPGIFSRSKWTRYSALRSWGWENTANVEVSLGLYSLDDVWHDLGISPDRRSWTSVFAEHKFETVRRFTNQEDRIYPDTSAAYDSIFNLADGVLMAESNWGPDYMNKEEDLEIPANRIVPLKHWSDVVWLVWLRVHADSEINQDVKNLEHIFRLDVTNKCAKARMAEVLRSLSPPIYEHPPLWPGVQLSVRDDMAMALMSMSNTVGIAWLLAQHKEQLGVKVVDEVRIFSGSCPYVDGTQWNMYFHIVDGPLGPGKG